MTEQVTTTEPELLARALESGVLPVVVIDDPAAAEPLGEALRLAEVSTVEVTLRTDAALESLSRLAAGSGLVVGAGTVRTPADVDAAVDAGAAYVVSPGLCPAVVDRCLVRQVPVLPGVATATEAMAASDLGLGTVKFFPAEANGGVRAVTALADALPGMRFVPTGGVTAETLTAYLQAPAVVACGGSWMVDRRLLATSDFDEVRRLAAEAVVTAARARVGRIR
jgi:2-dehydro-3-deoxyphosphogluconate aldolase/(4S)-4-hydroxy-2-oxoglutarate aldolase